VREHVILTLLGISSVAATFAGFSGVVAVFDRRAHGVWFPEESFRLINMLVISLAACLFSLLPLIEEMFSISEPIRWMTSSAVMGLFSFAQLLYALATRQRLRRSRPGALPGWATVMFIGCLGLTTALQFLNATRLVDDHGPGVYVVGLWLLLLAAGLQFALLVLVPVASGRSGSSNSEN